MPKFTCNGRQRLPGGPLELSVQIHPWDEAQSLARVNYSCTCGRNSVVAEGTPLLRAACHCTICQRISRKPFNDVVFYWRRGTSAAGAAELNFARHRAPPSANRGLCRHCGDIVIEYLGAPYMQVAFIPAANCAEKAALPPLAAHIFYDTRIADIADNLPKVSGYVPSYAFAIRRMTARMLKLA